jgi:hypothetical protein
MDRTKQLMNSVPLLLSEPTAPTGQMGIARQLVQEPLIPLDAPTQRPDEPVTFGVDAGPGPGS